MAFERIKYGYKIVLSVPCWSDIGTINIAKVRRVHAKTRYANIDNKRVETVDEFVAIVNKHSPRETYEHIRC